MVNLHEAIARLSPQHQRALQWFNDHRHQRVTWARLQTLSEEGPRLVNQAKGIYKPAYTDYALSVRTIQDGPYPDREVEHREDGSWVCQYFQENINPAQRDREATNRGLVRCMQDQVPVGFLIKRTPKPGVEYDVLGLAMVMGWDAGYFTLEGFGANDRFEARRDAAFARATQAINPTEPDVDFNAASDSDLRSRRVREAIQRQGQRRFRSQLIAAYGGRCCISSCEVTDVLEAAHISPYRGAHSNHPQNGLLLRGDLHSLFDLGLLAFDDDYRVLLAPNVVTSETYAAYRHTLIALPEARHLWPSRDALGRHRQWCGL